MIGFLGLGRALDRLKLNRLKDGLAKTRDQLGAIFTGRRLDESWFDDVETALLTADVGSQASSDLMRDVRQEIKAHGLNDDSPPQALRQAVADCIERALSPLAGDGLNRPTAGAGPNVVMVAGVNGAGKTTSIGKLAHAWKSAGKTVLLGAGDTFRAAAREQLMVWGARNQVDVISQAQGDPSAVAYDAVSAGVARHVDVVIVDTAGRLPTQLHLMEELKKVKRVMAKALPDAPHEVWLVIDGGTGQNAIAQVKAFDDALGLSGLVVTKLDGTAKGGVLLAIAKARPIPVRYIGVGEGIEDLQPFDAKAFAAALVGNL
ncbi:MAG: signal recognition particle-docking protein FtsY [Betaproteobacteria bacterium]|jgi:fused signal recognition particle receptor|nr:signal recognition particle-docking protein FtsY [Betaproteobacteria bacterium]